MKQEVLGPWPLVLGLWRFESRVVRTILQYRNAKTKDQRPKTRESRPRTKTIDTITLVEQQCRPHEKSQISSTWVPQAE